MLRLKNETPRQATGMQSFEKKTIKGYEGIYWINRNGYIFNKSGIKKQNLNSQGYPVVDLHKNGKRKTWCVHRLLAIHFIDNPDNKPCINHIDGNRANNALSNLEWCTQQENVLHAFRVLNRKNNFQTNHPKPSLGKFGKDHHVSKPVLQIKTGKIVKRWESAMDAVRKGYISSKISECCTGKRKTHAGYEWKFAKTS